MAVVSEADAFKALAHPMRIRIFKYLDTHGSATSAALGVALGTTSGTTSYHLRRLARHGFVEDDPERSSGRERWWRRAGGRDQRVVFADFAVLSDDARASAEAADRALYDDDRALLTRFVAQARSLGPWARGIRGGRHMSAEQLDAFITDVRALLERHGADAADAPPGARPVEVRLFALPSEDSDPTDPTWDSGT